ncbi:gp53-like domain-containing protein [Salmonella enterica subsp. enterica serovar Kiambu]
MLPTAGLGINGWHRDNATGLITQWGSGGFTSGQRINFPAVFPNVCTAVVGNDTGTGTLAISMTATDTHGFTVRSSSSTFGLNWIAKGY